MNSPLPRSWWPADCDAARDLAVKLRDEGAAAKMFEFLAVAAAMHDWAIFSAAIEALCEINVRGIRTMLENQKFDTGWALLYTRTGMPRDLFPLFIEILKVARKFELENSTAPATRAFRLAVLQQALTSPVLRNLQVPPDLKTALLD